MILRHLLKLLLLHEVALVCVCSLDTLSLKEENLQRLRQLLFPNHTKSNKSMKDLDVYVDGSIRALKGTYTTKVECVLCQGLKYCSNLNGFYLQEVYSPSDLPRADTCTYIDQLGLRFKKILFGVGRTFRDSEQCHSITLQYLCLFWGSNNDMYTNFCIFQEDVSNPDPRQHLLAPRPPCRSFCVQVAEVCANDVHFLSLCEEIMCPPTGDACNPDPVINGQVTAAGIGCSIPVEVSPYSAAELAIKYQLIFCVVSVLITSVLAYII